MVAVVKSPKDAALVYDSLSPDDQAAVHALIDKGTPKLHALNLVRSQRAQDTARTSVAADDETRDPTRSEQLGAAGMGAADAATFGLADEIRGALNIVPGVAQGMNAKDAYEEGRDDARAYSQGKLGAAYGAGQLASTAAQAGMGVGAGLAGVGTGLAGRAVSQGARLGAATGGLSGFGEGEGAGNSLKGAGLGAALGAALGMAPGAAQEAADTSAARAATTAADDSGASGGSGSVIGDVVNKIRSLPPGMRAVGRHIPFAGKAITIADSLAELGIGAPKAAAPAAPSASTGNTPALEESDLQGILNALKIGDQHAPQAPSPDLGAMAQDIYAAPSGGPHESLVPNDPDVPPSMMRPASTSDTPDWHVTPDQLAAGNIPPEAEADLARLSANVSGKGTTPLPSTNSMRAARAQALDDLENAPESPAEDAGEPAEAPLKMNEELRNSVMESEMPARQARAIQRSRDARASAPKSGADQKELIRTAITKEPAMAQKPAALARRLGLSVFDVRREINNILWGR